MKFFKGYFASFRMLRGIEEGIKKDLFGFKK